MPIKIDDFEVRVLSNGPKHLQICTTCGCNGSGLCGRAIDPSDASVWPVRDTGVRWINGVLVYLPTLRAQVKGASSD